MGVPCSILAPLIGYVIDNPRKMAYYNPANEAHALGLAAGFYLGSKQVPVVFAQNSGLGNMINPLTSLSQIYRIPVFLLITWRGEGGPGSDAPEHDITGRDLESYLSTFLLPHTVLSEHDYSSRIANLSSIARERNVPVVAVVRQGFFAEYKCRHKTREAGSLSRYEAITIIKESLGEHVFLSTTGFTSRESFAIRDSGDFYMMGSMGLVSGIGCGMALAQKDKRVAVLDGDGAVLMHLGLLPFIGSCKPANLIHFILDNQSYASTGNQPAVSPTVEFDKIALASGYRQAFKVNSGTWLKTLLANIKNAEGPILVWVRVNPDGGSMAGRVPLSPIEIRDNFLSKSEK